MYRRESRHVFINKQFAAVKRDSRCPQTSRQQLTTIYRKADASAREVSIQEQ